jgi:hypothetical protein
MAEAHGVKFEELVEKIIKMGLNREEQEFRIIVYE